MHFLFILIKITQSVFHAAYGPQTFKQPIPPQPDSVSVAFWRNIFRNQTRIIRTWEIRQHAIQFLPVIQRTHSIQCRACGERIVKIEPPVRWIVGRSVEYLRDIQIDFFNIAWCFIEYGAIFICFCPEYIRIYPGLNSNGDSACIPASFDYAFHLFPC